MVYSYTSQLEYAGISDCGLVRDHNEDRWAAYPEQRLFLLADGMGGHAAGEIAASTALSSVYEQMRERDKIAHSSPSEVVAFFRSAVFKANDAIYQRGQKDPALAGMGTTLLLLYFHQNHAIVAHVGDSRIYLLRSGRLEQLTADHSLIAELLALGAMRPSESENFPYKHILTRALGTQPIVEPAVNYLAAVKGDCFLLCSDGLTNFLKNDAIQAILNEELSLENKAQKLIDTANANGGGDNITAVLVKVHHDLFR